MKSERITIKDDKDFYDGGVKMRVSWGMVERALKRDGVLGSAEYLKAVVADEHGVQLTLGRVSG